ncbi:MAG: M20/M25/M40 family metallo-hydrolase [Bacilli bacterium]|nr:M20/M25/M40 family metallo-hydrolase [Bacilli bacterium]
MITLFIVCLIRALFFKPKKRRNEPIEKVQLDEEKAVEDLQALIRCKTVSHRDIREDNEEEFEKLEKTLQSNYPNVFKAAEFRKLGKREIMLRLLGKNGDRNRASVLMAHYDVVDVEKKNWKEEAFAGIRKDGELWGRGTIDTKGTLNGILCAADQLLSQGWTPENDMCLCFSGNEEVAGNGAESAVRFFVDNNIEPIVVLDEGGGIVNGLFPGVGGDTAVIGTTEKGGLSLEFHIDGEGGHASAPAPHTPVGELARLAVEIEKKPFPFRLTKAAREMFDVLGRHSSFKYRIVFANLWLFWPLLNSFAKKEGGQMNAVVRTTCALTMMQGSPVSNVVPSRAMIGMNLRLLPGETIKQVKAKYERMLRKLRINASMVSLYGWEASNISSTETESYRKVSKAIEDTWERQTIVAPFVMTACADARFWSRISDKVYRFSAMRLRSDQLRMIHGDNERLTEGQIAETVEFYYRLERSL